MEQCYTLFNNIFRVLLPAFCPQRDQPFPPPQRFRFSQQLSRRYAGGMKFVTNVTYPDNNMKSPFFIKPRDGFIKAWQVQNTGTCTRMPTKRFSAIQGTIIFKNLWRNQSVHPHAPSRSFFEKLRDFSQQQFNPPPSVMLCQ
jgi:hypothetical protein